jgi:type IV pilus assembly protein PilA
MKKRDRGFSLIELLIVVAIILIIAAIAIPNLLRSRIAANEASAVGSLRTLNTAEITYNTSYPTTGFACTLGAMGPPSGSTAANSTNAGLIDSTLGCTSQPCAKSGYSFTVACVGSGTPTVNYQSTATPVSPGVTGQRYFCSDASGVIKYDATSTANCLTNGNPI